ncbi:MULTISPECIES: hypothetical protein [unclassified Lentilitoribacter]|uniref:hypothetical protein n=1 Tax=unclassified Lentilitoribacter TaxID=2647570 RepID=UPI0013A6E659|nr:hypothetical protein [Lentilitoribacter sp. Alg239-R112]
MKYQFSIDIRDHADFMAGREVQPSLTGGRVSIIADQDEVEFNLRTVGKPSEGNEDLFVRLLNANPKRY